MSKYDINWNTTDEIDNLIGQIIERAERHGIIDNEGALTLNMDLVATHNHGCPLDFVKLLNAPDADFSHDIRGIQRHVSRCSGRLEGGFLPRCSA